jgi:hypothetical protein
MPFEEDVVTTRAEAYWKERLEGLDAEAKFLIRQGATPGRQEPGFVAPSFSFHIDDDNEEAVEWAKALGLDTNEEYHCQFSPIPLKVWAKAFDIPYPYIIYLAINSYFYLPYDELHNAAGNALDLIDGREFWAIGELLSENLKDKVSISIEAPVQIRRWVTTKEELTRDWHMALTYNEFKELVSEDLIEITGWSERSSLYADWESLSFEEGVKKAEPLLFYWRMLWERMTGQKWLFPEEFEPR